MPPDVPNNDAKIRALIRSEIERMQAAHRLPCVEDMVELRRIVDERRTASESYRRIRDTVIGWAIVGLLGVALGGLILWLHHAPPPG